VRQFTLALGARATHATVEDLAQNLDTRQQELFRQMPSMDQRHCLAVFRALREAGHAEPSLLQAALIHDVGKSLGPVGIRHRVTAVLGKALSPRLWERLDGEPGSWLYPFRVHRHHAALGAELAAQAGCSPEVVWLVAHHEDDQRDAQARDGMGGALAALQAADRIN
jgi:predicted HD phosphohydrolase